MNLSRKDFFKKAILFGGTGIAGGLTSGIAWSFVGNQKYKQDFPLLTENKVNLPKNGKSVLILGGGLAGLQAGCELSDRGFKVTILEKTSLPGGKLKAWKDHFFAKKYFKDSPFTREHGLHGIWGFYKNLREFLGRHEIEINKLSENESFYYFISKQNVQNKIISPTWPIPFDKVEMLKSSLYIPSFDDPKLPASKVFNFMTASLKLWSFDYLNPLQRNYLDSMTFYDWAKLNGMNDQHITHFFDGLSDMGFFMSTKECSALAIANFMRLGAVPVDSRVDYYKWPPDESFLSKMVTHIQNNGGEIHYNSEVTDINLVNNRIASVQTNQNFPKGKVKRCRVCGNIMGEGHSGECPFCGAHESMVELITKDTYREVSYTADHIICAMDIPGAKKIVSRISNDDPYFQNIKKLSTATIYCVNLLYENTKSWEKRFPDGSFWSTNDFMPTGYKILGFTTNWASKQIPSLKKEKAHLIEVQVSHIKEVQSLPSKEIANLVHTELKLILPDLPEYSEFYINKWDNYTASRPGDEANRPAIASPIENFYFIGDWVFIPHHCVFMEKTNVTAKMVTNLIVEKEKMESVKITILQSGTPDWTLDLLSLFLSVKS
jgi:uncharacterized protein with NAD-binding domain and iron-sulfur cluster